MTARSTTQTVIFDGCKFNTQNSDHSGSRFHKTCTDAKVQFASISGLTPLAEFYHEYTDSLKYLISQLTELEHEEQSLILALLKESTAADTSHMLPLFKVKRVDAKTRNEDEPVNWAMLVSMQYLTGTSSDRADHGDCVSFYRYQHPLEPVHNLVRQDRIHSIRQMSPVYQVSFARFCAFLTSSGEYARVNILNTSAPNRTMLTHYENF